jgi:hypothetical protein
VPIVITVGEIKSNTAPEATVRVVSAAEIFAASVV